MGKPKVVHEIKECIGCGACAAIAPDFWELDDENKARLKGGKAKDSVSEREIEEKDLQANKDAAEACPVNAIKVFDKAGKKVV